ncbi:hypothetical protein PsYK624_060580 [Phanerochaete sordida]|uniref:C2H2-type domain-containing protein n=1 Tax=Phanerochaete sordida TaxID=48140 RepID=A0A9P3G9P5_9APHY|nr:hypothetical protein PsYK624_060580 [Phanerochaete sordida]
MLRESFANDPSFAPTMPPPGSEPKLYKCWRCKRGFSKPRGLSGHRRHCQAEAARLEREAEEKKAREERTRRREREERERRERYQERERRERYQERGVQTEVLEDAQVGLVYRTCVFFIDGI